MLLHATAAGRASALHTGRDRDPTPPSSGPACATATGRHSPRLHLRRLRMLRHPRFAPPQSRQSPAELGADWPRAPMSGRRTRAIAPDTRRCCPSGACLSQSQPRTVRHPLFQPPEAGLVPVPCMGPDHGRPGAWDPARVSATDRRASSASFGAAAATDPLAESTVSCGRPGTSSSASSCAALMQGSGLQPGPEPYVASPDSPGVAPAASHPLDGRCHLSLVHRRTGRPAGAQQSRGVGTAQRPFCRPRTCAVAPDFCSLPMTAAGWAPEPQPPRPQPRPQP